MGRLVFIAVEQHNESTLLDALLSTHSEAFDLGEVSMLASKGKRDKYLSTKGTRLCTCGRPISECPVWGTLIDLVEGNPDYGSNETYPKFLSIVKGYTNSAFLSDSSKYIASLRKTCNLVLNNIIEGIGKGSLVILKIIKDVESYLALMCDRHNLGYIGLIRYTQK
jgi:hypothetical protein